MVWEKNAEVYILVIILTILKYRCRTMAERYEFCFPVILKKDSKQKEKIDMGYDTGCLVLDCVS